MKLANDKKGTSSNLSGFTASFQKAMPYINLIYMLIGSIAMFGLIGWWLDKKLLLKPWLFIAGLFIGLVIGFYHFFKSIKKLEEKNN